MESAADQLGLVRYVVLGCYLLMLLAFGIAGYRKSKNTEEDYYLAGRGQGWLVSSLTIMATFFSSFALLGAPGLVYREGVVFALFSLNVPLSGACVYFLGARISRIGRAKGYVTPADMICGYYGESKALRLLVALIGVLYAVPYVIMQIKAGGILSEIAWQSTTWQVEKSQPQSVSYSLWGVPMFTQGPSDAAMTKWKRLVLIQDIFFSGAFGQGRTLFRYRCGGTHDPAPGRRLHRHAQRQGRPPRGHVWLRRRQYVSGDRGRGDRGGDPVSGQRRADEHQQLWCLQRPQCRRGPGGR